MMGKAVDLQACLRPAPASAPPNLFVDKVCAPAFVSRTCPLVAVIAPSWNARARAVAEQIQPS